VKAHASSGAAKARRPAARFARLARKAASEARSADASSVRTILKGAGAQPELAVSSPGDAFEVEADRVAERVAAGKPAPLISRLSESTTPQRAAKPESEEPKKSVQKKERGAIEEEKKPVQRKDSGKEQEEKRPVQRAAVESVPNLEDVAERAIASKGSGSPLEPATRSALESNMGVDFGGVRVHDDAGAHAAADALGARAFTHGSDIWLGSGESQSDTRLMAHEATHVVQQQSGMAQRLVQRDPTDPAPAVPGGAPATSDVFPVETFELPHIKARHQITYQGWASGRKLQRERGYDRSREGDPGQQAIWLRDVPLPGADVLERMQINLENPNEKEIRVNDKAVVLPAGRAALERVLKIPTWDRHGNTQDFQVDHIVELQAAGWPTLSQDGNRLQNMELLDQRSNASAGGSTRMAVRDSVRHQLERAPAPGGASGTAPRTVTEAEINDVLATKHVVFDAVSGGPRGRRADTDSRWWSQTDITEGEHLRNARPFRNLGEVGRADAFCLLTPTRTMVIAEFPHSSNEIAVNTPAQRNRIAGLTIESITLRPNYTAITGTDPIADIDAQWNLPPGVMPANPDVTLEVRRHSQYSGFVGDLPGFGADMPGASPVEFSPPRVEGGQIVASGQLHPTLPLLGDRPIDLRIVGNDIELGYAFDVGAISLPIPGVTIDESTLFLFFGTRGLGAEGTIVFSIRQLGSGSITAAISTERGFEARGRFLFDRRLFDRAEIEVSYSSAGFGARGTIGIDDPNKIKGIRSAEISVGYEAGTFSASGRVAPSIPGVQEAGLTVAYSETEGLTIGGTLTLADNVPGIRSGAIDVTVQKREDTWKVSGTGRAQPAIPGIDSELTLEYDDGAFNAGFRGSFRRGMLSGNASVGVTNRTLDAAGDPTGDPSADGTLIVFGSGSATIQIAPWLQGTVGVAFAPNGEITVSGEIGLPGQIEIFARKQIERSLLNIAIQIPIVPGIVAEVGGGLSVAAGIGPGVIDQLRIGITYNPAHEDQTHVTGDAHLNIPADAGLRLAVRAGIGLGITGASAMGGLEIGGMLGIFGAAEAGVHIDWTPATGLRIDAFGELSAQPKFRFDISGYVSVRALGFSVYDQRWELAAFEFGSDLRFGARFPIHYVEGQPFDISLNDVEFIVPDIDPQQMLRDLVARVA
jgi:hypothetical protein